HNNTDVPSQGGKLARPDIDAINSDAATRDVVKARNQLRNSALATASTAKQGNDLARRGAEADVVQHRDTRTVAKADVLELDPALETRQEAGLRSILDVRNHIEDFEQALRSCLTQRRHAREPAQTAERLGQLGEIACGSDQRPQAH